MARLVAALRPQTKAGEVSGVTLIPGLNFHSPDGTRTIWRFGDGASDAEQVSATTAYVSAAYAFAAMRWRAERMAEPPLMIVAEDQGDGTEKWLPSHPLVPVLESPTDDYDMGELLFRTSLALDMWGRALWVKDAAANGRPARLQIFRGDEFSVEATRERVRGLFRVTTARGSQTLTPEQVVYFHEPHPSDWTLGTSRLDVALAWLNLSQHSRATIRDLLRNSLSPSLIIQPDKDWNPDAEGLQRFQEGLDRYAMPGQRGRAITFLGGGTATPLGSTVKDILPGELLNRVESVVSSVFGVPAIVLQYLVGMENSPWSQMAQARRMAYEDTAIPMWRTVEKALTRQLLRPMDPDTTHYVRYDTSKVPALQADRQQQTQIAASWSDIASANERRALVGLEPVPDPAADEMPWQASARREEALAARFDALRQTDARPAEDADADGKMQRKARRDLWAALRAEQIAATEHSWALTASRLLAKDQQAVTEAVEKYLADGKADTTRPEQRKRLFAWLDTFFATSSAARWVKETGPLAERTAERGAVPVLLDLGIDFALAKPGLAAFADAETSFLARSVSETTVDAVKRAVVAGLDAGLPTRDIAAAMKDLPAFNADRAMLVARTEGARLMNGAPTESLRAVGEATGRAFGKTWSTAGDDRVRDEHAAMDGETAPVDGVFSNGLSFPSEPNCRCVVTFEEVGP